MNQNKFNIAIASGKGGVGKSMLSSCLSMLFAKDYRILATDCDVDAPNLSVWLGDIRDWQKTIPVTTSFKPVIDLEKCNGCGLCKRYCQFNAMEMKTGQPHLNPFLCEGCGVCEIVCPQKAIHLKPVQNGRIRITETKYGFVLVEGQLFPGETGSGKIVEEIKEEAEKIIKDYSETVIMITDSSPGTGCPVIASLRNADFVLLVTEPTLSGWSDLKRVLKVVEHFNLKFGLVINKWDVNKEISQKISKEFQKELLGKISYDKAIFKSLANFTPILETDLKIKKELKEIYIELKKRISF